MTSFDVSDVMANPEALPLLPEMEIVVSARRLDALSGDGRETFGYQVELYNQSHESWKLIFRHWDIMDASGRQFSVDGEGVVGEQPLLPPQGRYTYDSMVSINEAPGIMQGYYVMQDAWGNLARAVIPPFRLGELSAFLLN